MYLPLNIDFLNRVIELYFQDGTCTYDGITLPVITDANLYIKNIDYDISDDVLHR